MAKKKEKRPNRVSIHYEHLLYDLDLMSNENAGIILKMVVWYAMGDERSLKEIERMKKHIDVLPERPWLVSMYRRLFMCIDEDLEQYNEVCEKRRQAVAKREEYKRERLEKSTSNDNKCYQMMSGNSRSSENTIVDSKGKANDNTCNQMLTNDIQYNPIQSNTIQSNSSNEDKYMFKEEEEEDAREEKKSEALSLDSFCELWNGAIARAKRKRDVVAMKPVARADLPSDAQERIGKALRDIRGWLDDQTRQRIFKACKVRQDASEEDLAKWYMLVAMNRLSEASIKPRDSSFGSFNWFVNYPRRIKKLFDGDIM